MEKVPKCPLCSCSMEQERNVRIQAGGSNVLSYTLAWVCVNCSAAFPVAVGSGGILRSAKPLYKDGQRVN